MTLPLSRLFAYISFEANPRCHIFLSLFSFLRYIEIEKICKWPQHQSFLHCSGSQVQTWVVDIKSRPLSKETILPAFTSPLFICWYFKESVQEKVSLFGKQTNKQKRKIKNNPQYLHQYESINIVRYLISFHASSLSCTFSEAKTVYLGFSEPVIWIVLIQIFPFCKERRSLWSLEQHWNSGARCNKLIHIKARSWTQDIV